MIDLKDRHVLLPARSGKGRSEDIGKWRAGALSNALPALSAVTYHRPRRMNGAFIALLVLIFLYFGRPEDVIRPLAYVPMAKISGGIAFIAFLFVLMQRARIQVPAQIKILWFILFWFLIGIPFAIWRGGDLNVLMSRFSKGIVVATLVGMLAQELWQLKRLIWLQAATVGFMTIVSLIAHRTTPLGRLQGYGYGIFMNPNDFANNIAMNWPLCVAFLFMSSGLLRKLAWGGAAIGMLLAVPLTYSRSGFLAMSLAGALIWWEFALKRQRFEWVLIALLMASILLVFSPGHYITRLESIVTGNEQYSMDHGSREQRILLFKESLNMAVHHPIFGIGAGNFEVTSGWHVAHNSYTEIAAEGGFPALIMLLIVLRLSFRDLKT